MSVKHRVKYGYNANVLRAELPDDYDTITAAAITITKDADGTDLLAATAATVYTATTLNGAVEAGADTVTVDSGADNLAAGDLIRISSTSGGAETMRVTAYNATTKVATLDDYLLYDHESGAAVTARWLTYTLDASTTSTWTSGLDFTIEWNPTSDNQPWTEPGEILERTTGGASGTLFSVLYSHYDKAIPSGKFNDYESAANEELRSLFLGRGVDIDKLVASYSIQPLIMAQMALFIAETGDDTWAGERAAMGKKRDDLLDSFTSSYQWIDKDQDLAVDDGEEIKMTRPSPVRQLW